MLLHWIVLRVAANCERIVAEEITGSGHVGYCPMGAKLVTRKYVARPFRVELPAFSRYVFAGFAEGVSFQRREFRRIVGILGNADGPQAVPAKAIEHIRAREAAGEWDETSEYRKRLALAALGFTPGDMARATTGPFASFTGIIDEVTAEATIKLLIDIFGRKVPIELDACQVEKVC